MGPVYPASERACKSLSCNSFHNASSRSLQPSFTVRLTTGAAARISGARGSVLLDVVLLEDGSPKILRILRSLSPEADESAVRHFGQWRFSPALRNGVPVKVRMNAEVRFHG